MVKGRSLSASPLLRAALVLLAVGLAYRYSLRTLLNTVGTDTPLAYLGLAPIIACGVALVLARPVAGRADIHDRHIDYLVGLPLLGTALIMTLALPARMSILFWYYRVDLLSLPLFVAGAVALLFGASTLWRIRYAIGFLLLAWPAPYNYALDHGMGSFANLTLGALHWLVRWIPVARVQAGGDGSIFVLHHAGTFFTLSVASACTGVDSFIGFLLVGLAVMTVVDGPTGGRTLWMAAGMALSYALNLVRLMLIFLVGTQYGEKVALDGLHPVLGLILFCAGVAVMVTGMGRFGLEVRAAAAPAPVPASTAAPASVSTVPPSAAAAPTAPVPVSTAAPALASTGPASAAAPPAPVPASASTVPDRPKWRMEGSLRLAALALAGITALVALADGGFAKFGPVADDLGAPRLVSFTADPIDPVGWTVAAIDHYPWAGQYYGSGAVWTRYQFSPSGGAGVSTVLADVINTSDLQSFSTYDVIACYDYHGYGLSDEQRVGLGDGVEATELTFSVPSLSGEWNALYWVWPVKDGAAVHYERIVLLDPVDGGYIQTAEAAAPSTRPIAVAADRQSSRQFLLRFGQSLVSLRTTAPDGGQPA